MVQSPAAPKSLTGQGIRATLKAPQNFPYLENHDPSWPFFEEHSLTYEDYAVFVQILNKFCITFGPEPCWDLKRAVKSMIPGFDLGHPKFSRFKRIYAKPLALAVVEKFADETNSLCITRHNCKRPHCINPHHFYWGTKKDIAFENAKRNKSKVTPELVEELREKYGSSRISVAALAREYSLPYHIVSRICRYAIYA